MTKIVEKGFYLMRHGQILNNKLGLETGGGVDQPLIEEGKAEAEKARKVYQLLKPLPTDIIVTDLVRTAQTAEIMTGIPSKSFIIEPGLKERMLGELDAS